LDVNQTRIINLKCKDNQ